MAESALFHTADRRERYRELWPQLDALTRHEPDFIANLANAAAALRQAFGFFWVGFYLVRGNELVLGPFQGPVACTRIALGCGVCGTVWAEKRPICVEDVERFPGHIACSSESRSEVVVPILVDGAVVAILDIDSDRLSDFDAVDVEELQQLALMAARWYGMSIQNQEVQQNLRNRIDVHQISNPVESDQRPVHNDQNLKNQPNQ
ncbi:MAG: GAF domain-containing protein [Sphingomonadales bacterium]|nr:GAF domain-containing protein [Sphingomonadales bacterium]